MKNTLLTITLTLLSFGVFAQLPSISDADAEVKAKNYLQHIAKKFNVDQSKITVTKSKMFFSKTKVAEQEGWGNDKAETYFKFTSPKNSDGVWYEQDVYISFVKSLCSTSYGVETCVQLNNWELKGSYQTYFTEKGAKEVSDAVYINAVENYIEDKQEAFLNMTYKEYKDIIEFKEISIWTKKDHSKPTERVVMMEITGILGVFTEGKDELKSVKAFSVKPTFVFTNESGNWAVKSASGAMVSYNSAELDGKLYGTYDKNGYFALNNKRIELEVPVKSCKVLKTVFEDFYNDYTKLIAGEKTDISKYFESSSDIKKEIETISFLIENGYELKTEGGLTSRCSGAGIVAGTYEQCFAEFRINISHPKAKAKMIKDLEKHDRIERAEKLMSGTPRIYVKIKPEFKDGKWHLIIE